jgi:hypothetical protein
MIGNKIMAVHAAWDNAEKTIMRWTFEGVWTWDEYYTLRTETNQKIAAEKTYGGFNCRLEQE